MKHQYTYLEVFELETQQAEQSACFSRFGRLIDFNQATNSVKVNFADNPIKQPIWARLERRFTEHELELAIKKQVRCKIEFVNQDLTLPIVTDFLFDLFDDGKELVLRADKLAVESSTELTIRSGDAETCYRGKEGSVTTNAEHVLSNASNTQSIVGGTIAIN
ncbi:hypothetical protein GCM10007938_02850 [Vibrio zhanjiangensis]|uniref:Uncharacterized protein n=1 Tax=Vibrio zhanjiangensis TaxID=1046128 RepID=A0ABQ6EU42_9VIBR|nr:hypothetical protein [Vibrio zhanjiangensis]GLT16509.1 hypothetical protein GCM10007938_02850 [Vibrio zhanjiangensis]